MTSLQVDYWKLGETTRSNKAGEKLRSKELGEATRHNKATEEETQRHNVATEAIQKESVDVNRAAVAETARHNVATEQVANYNALTQRQSVEDWRTIQDKQVLIAQENVEIAREKNRLQDLEIVVQQDKNLIQEKQTNYEIRNEQQLRDLRESENRRQWVTTIVNAGDTIFGSDYHRSDAVKGESLWSSAWKAVKHQVNPLSALKDFFG